MRLRTECLEVGLGWHWRDDWGLFQFSTTTRELSFWNIILPVKRDETFSSIGQSLLELLIATKNTRKTETENIPRSSSYHDLTFTIRPCLCVWPSILQTSNADPAGLQRSTNKKWFPWLIYSCNKIPINSNSDIIISAIVSLPASQQSAVLTVTSSRSLETVTHLLSQAAS